MADKPVTREEKYLAYLTGDYAGELPKPITRKEKYLYELCLKGMGGEVSPEEIKSAVNEYLEKNPVKPGATTEQAQQIEQNKTDVASLKAETSSLKEDLSNKITKFYASNQGETHLTDSDNGKIQDMMIYGKSSQDGTPTPENPVEIKSVVNPTVKVCGANILNIKNTDETISDKNGLTYSAKNGVIKVKGTATSSVGIGIMQQTANTRLKLKKNNTYIFNPNPVKTKESDNVYLDLTNSYSIGFSFKSNNINKPIKITENDTKREFDLAVRVKQGEVIDMEWKPQFLLNESLLPYKPYTEQTVTLPYTLNAIPVSSGGNVTIDGQQYIADYVDVERGKLVRMVGVTDQDTFTTSEWSDTGAIVIFSQIPNVSSGNAIVTISSKFTTDWAAGDEIHHFTQSIGQALVIVLPKTITTVEQGEEIRAKGFKVYYILETPIEIDLSPEEIAALKELTTYYPTTNISVNSEQLDGYTVLNYPISMQNGWNYVKQQLNDNRDYIYDMDLQSAEAYVNSEYAVALTELEV